MLITPYLHGDQVRYQVLAHAQVVVGGTAAGLPAIPSGDVRKEVKRVVIRPIDGDLFWTGDGTDPTGDTAFPALENEILVYDGNDLESFLMVAALDPVDVRVIYMC